VTWEGLSPPYRTIVADPPWEYAKTNADKSAEGYAGRKGLPYSGMSLNQIQAFNLVREIADEDARLFLWTTNRYLRHAWDIAEMWGFHPQDRTLVWCKTPRATTPVTTEFVLIAKRGNPPRMPWHGTTWFNWPLQSQHSRKPAAFYDLVEQWCPGPYVDVFCREPRLGWDSWGYGYESALTAPLPEGGS
jgi:N6-adenosine-specific RNA methylase IME4